MLMAQMIGRGITVRLRYRGLLSRLPTVVTPGQQARIAWRCHQSSVMRGCAKLGMMAIRRIGIMGAGAIGSVVGGMLTKAGYDVTLIDQWPPHRGDEGERPHAQRLVRRPCRARRGAPVVRGPGYPGAVRRRLPRRQGVRHRVGDGVHHALPGRSRTASSSTSRTASTTSASPPSPGAIVPWAVITIGRMYEPGHGMRTGRGGFKIGELDNEETARPRAGRDHEQHRREPRHHQPVRRPLVQLAVNSMANLIAGLSGYGSNEVRTLDLPRSIAIQVAAEAIAVGRAAGYEIEPLMGSRPRSSWTPLRARTSSAPRRDGGRRRGWRRPRCSRT